MVKKILLSLIGVLVFAAGAFAQAKQVRGSVVDENGAAVIGASVIVKGTTIGVSTDQQGFFVMNNVPAKSEELQISYLGYVTQDVKIRPNMQITLVPDEQTIESVVVTGMTKTDKRLFTGAADRLSAAPGTRAAGAVTYAVHYYAAPRTLFTVQPGSFYPPPKVTSAVIQLRLHEAPPVTPRNAEAMFRVIRAAFSQRRKTAANAASAGLHLPKEAVAEALAAAGVPPTARPEQLTLQNYADVSDALFAFR